jgi:hypothetical protein
VVRGEDLLVSTFRQLLLYRAFDLVPPRFFHTPLIVDESGGTAGQTTWLTQFECFKRKRLRGGRTARSLPKQIVEEPFITGVIPSDSRETRMRNL